MTELLITWSDGAGPRPSDLLPTASIQRAEIAKGGARPIETESLATPRSSWPRSIPT